MNSGIINSAISSMNMRLLKSPAKIKPNLPCIISMIIRMTTNATKRPIATFANTDNKGVSDLPPKLTLDSEASKITIEYPITKALITANNG